MAVCKPVQIVLLDAQRFGAELIDKGAHNAMNDFNDPFLLVFALEQLLAHAIDGLRAACSSRRHIPERVCAKRNAALPPLFERTQCAK